MVYKVSHLIVFLLLGAVLTGATLFTAANLDESTFSGSKVIQEFLFRTPIQWVTLTVFFFSLVILMHRLVYHFFFVAPGLRCLQAGDPVHSSTRLARERFQKVRSCRDTKGSAAAASYNRELAQQGREKLECIYTLLASNTGLMLALGFLGTVWGVRQQIFGSGSGLTDAGTEQLKAFLESFTSGLGTALETTLLAIACSLVVTILMAFIHWIEIHAVEMTEESVSTRLGIEAAAHSQAAEWLDLVRIKLTDIAHDLIAEVNQTMRELAAESTRQFETKLSQALEQVLDRAQEHERRVFRSLSEKLESQNETMLRALHEQGTSLSRAMITELQRIGEQLQRSPEISIRYPSSNGKDASVPRTFSED